MSRQGRQKGGGPGHQRYQLRDSRAETGRGQGGEGGGRAGHDEGQEMRAWKARVWPEGRLEDSNFRTSFLTLEAPWRTRR